MPIQEAASERRQGPLLDVDSSVDSRQAEEPLGLRGDVYEDELVTDGLRALLSAAQQVDAGAVDEVQRGKVDHDTSRQRAFGLVELALQLGGRCHVDLSLDDQRHAVRFVSPLDRELALKRSRMRMQARHDADSKRAVMRSRDGNIGRIIHDM
jgi:hypothetical protein